MAKAKKPRFDVSFNFGTAAKGKKRSGKGKKGGSGGGKANAWRSYTSGGGRSSAPIPD